MRNIKATSRPKRIGVTGRPLTPLVGVNPISFKTKDLPKINETISHFISNKFHELFKDSPDKTTFYMGNQTDPTTPNKSAEQNKSSTKTNNFDMFNSFSAIKNIVINIAKNVSTLSKEIKTNHKQIVDSIQKTSDGIGKLKNKDTKLGAAEEDVATVIKPQTFAESFENYLNDKGLYQDERGRFRNKDKNTYAKTPTKDQIESYAKRKDVDPFNNSSINRIVGRLQEMFDEDTAIRKKEFDTLVSSLNINPKSGSSVFDLESDEQKALLEKALFDAIEKFFKKHPEYSGGGGNGGQPVYGTLTNWARKNPAAAKNILRGTAALSAGVAIYEEAGKYSEAGELEQSGQITNREAKVRRSKAVGGMLGGGGGAVLGTTAALALAPETFGLSLLIPMLTTWAGTQLGEGVAGIAAETLIDEVEDKDEDESPYANFKPQTLQPTNQTPQPNVLTKPYGGESILTAPSIDVNKPLPKTLPPSTASLLMNRQNNGDRLVEMNRELDQNRTDSKAAQTESQIINNKFVSNTIPPVAQKQQKDPIDVHANESTFTRLNARDYESVLIGSLS